jgi:hypothetical protein
MMIGMCAVSSRVRTIPAHLDATQYRQVEVENDQIGLGLRQAAQRRIAGPDDVHLHLTGLLERVLDEPGNILLVFRRRGSA